MSSLHMANALIDNPEIKEKGWIAFAPMKKVIRKGIRNVSTKIEDDIKIVGFAHSFLP